MRISDWSSDVCSSDLGSGCWQASEVAAAKVRDLQTRMMVAGLKCRGYGPEMLAAYNRFVVVHRTSIQRHNGVLRARFIRTDGRSAGQRGYDRYTTALAHAYGATSADPAACGEKGALAQGRTSVVSGTSGCGRVDIGGR